MKKNRIGYACTPVSIPYKTSRSFILKNFSENIFNECVKANINDLNNILRWNVLNGIYMFRISSDIIPFASHAINNIKWWEIFKDDLIACGNFIKENHIRVSMHPGQYTVINSNSEDVVRKSIEDLEYHCRFLDTLQVDYTNKIILHVGGVYGDKASAMERFKHNFRRLSPSAQNRLVIENDDKSYTVKDVLELSRELNIPVVFDNLHHELNPCDIAFEDILFLVKNTWKAKDGSMKLHYSDKDLEKRGGAHSKFVITESFLNYIDKINAIDADIMLEVKDKEISALKCIFALEDNLKKSIRTEQWAKYKYSVMEKGYAYYKNCSRLINSETKMSDIYIYIDEVLSKPFDAGSFRNAAEHVYGYVKDKTTLKEKELFKALLADVTNNNNNNNNIKIKDLLQRLCKKYGSEYINASYYFIY